MSKQLEKLRHRASVDCRKFIQNELDCDATSSKNSKFEHRINKVLSDAVWHLTGAKKCRAANEKGNWASTYRRRRQAAGSNDTEYYYYASSEYSSDYYASDEYSSDYYQSDEYDSDEYAQASVGIDQRSDFASAVQAADEAPQAGPGANKFLGRLNIRIQIYSRFQS